jgi:hypothetical protein
MTWKMKRKINRDFEEIEILKQKYLQRISDQEQVMKASFTEVRDNITGFSLLNKLKENLMGGSGLAFRLGFMAVSLIRSRMKAKSVKKS